MKFCFVLLLLLILMGCSCVSTQYLDSTCSSSNYTSVSISESESDSYRESIREVISSLIGNSSFSLFHNTSSQSQPSSSNTTSTTTIYGMYQCKGGISLQDCFACVNDSQPFATQKCPSSFGAHILMESCHVRYDNQSGLFDGTHPDTLPLFFLWNTNQNPNQTYESNILEALLEVTKLAPFEPGLYAQILMKGIYAQAQCDSYLDQVQCSKCFGSIPDYVSFINQSIGGQVYFGSCFYRYESYLFYNIPPPSPSPLPLSPPSVEASSPSIVSENGSSASVGSIVGGVIGSIVFAGLIAYLIFFYYRRKKKSQAVRLYQDLNPFHPSATIYSYNELRVATQDFHPHNKLGQGGFGPVYKGTLSNGQEVAIKKLSISSHQGKQEFTNEVTLITSVQHRNLIKLFGCCIEGPERLLVYEYLPNKSLDKFIFDREDGNRTNIVLDWKTRVEIIQGIARGLAYLHEDSQVHIIHRDIKPGNILLDNDLTPKIADFGLARLFNNDTDHVTTTIAGTIGYLSPEYAMHGQLTEKADVFSFGVVTLEIVSGRRNTDYTQPEEKQRLVEWAWKCYREGEQLQLLDPRLINLMTPLEEEEEEEMARVIHVAILCTQSTATDRPSMSKAGQLLGGKNDNLDVPNNCPFSITTSLDHLRSIIDTTSSIPSTLHSSLNSSSISRQNLNVTSR